VHLATEEALARDYPEFDLGAVPPVGGPRRDPVVIDSRLAERESVVLEAGSHDESIRVACTDLFRLTGAKVADISQE
jgi:Ala-tRNA(Pro) deacylase